MSNRKSHRPLNSKIEVPWDPSEDLILGNSPTGSSETVQLTEIHLPDNQPRRYFDPQAHQKLVESIKEHGILQPLLVRFRDTGSYELVAGERRYRAAVALGLTEVPVVKKELDDAQAFQLALIENLQREDLNPIEETEGILHLLAIKLNKSIVEIPPLLHRMQHQQKETTANRTSNNVIGSGKSVNSANNVIGKTEMAADSMARNGIQLSQEQATVIEIFNVLGRMTWESFINNRLPLLNLPEDVLETVRSGKIAYTKARAVAQLKDQTIREATLEKAITENWSLEQIKARIRTLKPKLEQSPLRQRFEATYQKAKKVKLWDNPNQQERLKKLLSELELLLEED